MVEYYNLERGIYRKDGSIKCRTKKTFIRASDKSVSHICNSGVTLAALVFKGVLALAINRNPYNLPK